MDNRFKIIGLLVCIGLGGSFTRPDATQWGFFGHRLINKVAVFTLPVEMLAFYKSQISYVEKHAVDPDKRRYTVKTEGIKHFIDLDIKGQQKEVNLSRDLESAIFDHATITGIRNRDTVVHTDLSSWSAMDSLSVKRRQIENVIKANLNDILYGKKLELRSPNDTLFYDHEDSLTSLEIEDRFTNNGILPYHMETLHKRLEWAFATLDSEKILRFSTDLGHYIADAHVPLHTTVNYDGQLTGQQGIHAFWETRIPELYAISDFDLLVGKANYVSDIREFYWSMVLESHELVDEVFETEKRVRISIPPDMRYCFTERNGVTTRLECREWAAAYKKELEGMVERQMQKSIKAIGDAWFTAWVDAGRPPLIPTK